MTSEVSNSLHNTSGSDLTAQVSLSIHPAALLFPMMGEDELSKLADDIATNGLLEPVVLYRGEVLDGRNRLAACELAGVEPRFAEVDGDLPSATIYVLSKNLHRRHLTISQRAAIAADVVPLLQDEAKKRQGGNTRFGGSTPSGVEPSGDNFISSDAESGRSNKIAAEALNVGERTVCRAVKVKKENPEAHERVKRGEITVNEASGDQEAQNEKRRKQSEKDATAPYQPQTDHQKKLASGQKDRLVHALSMITGICRGLEGMDIRKALSACDEEERKTWTDRAKELASQLRAFSARLQKGF